MLDTPTIRHAIAALAGAAIVVTPDTSVVHIAAAFDTPIVALYPNVEWNLKKFRPLSTRAEVVQPDDAQAFADIPAARVIAALRRVAAGAPRT